MEISTKKARLEKDLAELEALLVRAEAESCGSADDEIAQRLIRQLIEQRRSQLAVTSHSALDIP